MTVRGLILALVLSLAAPAAMAQDAPVATAPDQSTDLEEDTIGDLLDEAEDAAPAPPVQTAPPPAAPAVVYGPPLSYQRPRLDRPVNIDERGLTPEGPLQPQELGYDMRVRASLANAQGRQGPLDGGWTVASADGTKLYNLQVVDPGDGTYALEGAWRSLQRQGIGTTGLLSSLDRSAASLSIRFYRREGGDPTVFTLSPLLDGSWRGEMWEDGATKPVVMRRN